MAYKRLIAAVLATSIALSFLTLYILPASGKGDVRVLTPEQLRLVEEKQRAREAAALDKPEVVSASAKANAPVQQLTYQHRATKAELLAEWQLAWESNQSWLTRLENVNRESAARERTQLLEVRKKIQELPAGETTISVPAVEVGTHSMSFSLVAQGSLTSDPTDPINLVFWNEGSAWDVNYDLENWTSEDWESTCGGTMKLWIFDQQHGSIDGFKAADHQLTPVSDTNACTLPLAARNHLRLWGSFTYDTHGEYGEWTAANAHHDDWGHDCPDDWEGPEWRVFSSFMDSNGNPLWFVGQVWDTLLGNSGTFHCAWSNGVAKYIELTS